MTRHQGKNQGKYGMTPAVPTATEHPYLTAFHGRFQGIMRWNQLDALWEQVLAHPEQHWYVHVPGEPPPDQPLEPARLQTVIRELDALLHREHREDYCGIVYADDLQHPGFIKVFDPHNLGATCGSSAHPPLPGWILSRLPPINLPAAVQPPNNRRRWWQNLLWGGA